MVSQIQTKRRVNGAVGSPGAPGALEGELALNFPGAAGAAGKPELWAFDGTAWRQVNPASSVSTQTVNLDAPGGADVGAAAAAWSAIGGNSFTGSIVIGTFGGTAYVLANMGAPGVAASWTALGSATSFATAAEIQSATAGKAIAPDQLRINALKVPSAAGVAAPADEDHLVRLNNKGQIDSGFLPITSMHIHSSVAPIVDPATIVPAVKEGDIIFMSADGNLHHGWGITGDPHVSAGDAVIYDGTKYHVVPNELDMAAYLLLAGGSMTDGAAIAFDTTTVAGATKAADLVIIDGNGGTIDNAVLNAGTF